MVDAEDRPHTRRLAFGVPTESVRRVTAAGIRPRVNSVIPGDADAMARASLRITFASKGGDRIDDLGRAS